MRRLFVTLILAFAVTANFAQTLRMFKLVNSSDGLSVLTCYLPEHPTGRAIVDCPGGGYSHLATAHEGHDWAQWMNQQGIAFFVLEYRMPHGNRELPLSDAYSAMKLVRDSAEAWHINPRDVGIMGFSAGGHLASSVCTHAEWEARPDFAILFYPVISMNEGNSHAGSVRNFLGEDKNNASLVCEWSNDMKVRRHLTPPALIILANNDGAVPPVTNAVAYYSAMRRAGNNCSMLIYPDGGHGFGFRKDFSRHDEMLESMKAWLSEIKAPKVDAVRVACVGNSITDGSGIDMAENNGYPAQLQNLLGEGYDVRNFGVGARTLLNSGDHPYMIEQAWKDVLAFNPNIVVVKLGTNDSKTNIWHGVEEFMNDYQMMIDKFKTLPSRPAIYLATPITAYKSTFNISDSTIVSGVIPTINKVAKKNKLKVIDLHAVFNNNDGKQMQRDGIHPTREGAKQIARIVSEAIK